MGNKTNPNALRLGYIHDWQSKWFSTKDAPALIGEDFKIRNLVRKAFRMAAVSWVGIISVPDLWRHAGAVPPLLMIGREGIETALLLLQLRQTLNLAAGAAAGSSRSCATGTSCSTDTMEVDFMRLGGFVIDDCVDVFDIETTGSKVGC